MADESRKESVLLTFDVDESASIESIESLTKANKALREERNKLNLQSEAGKKRAQEINTLLDQNTGKIKENVSAIEKQKINIGNYKSALDGVHPALGKIGQGLEAGTKGFKAMTLQALAFIATPIGLVIAAIGAALYALTAYFKGSEEGQNNLNKIMAVGSAIMEQFMNVVEAVGKAIFDAVSNPKQALLDFGTAIKENIVNRFFGLLELIPNLGKAIGLLFKGQFVEAGKVAFDAVTKVSLGVDQASAKIAGLVESTAALVEQGISNGQKLANLNAKIVKDERALTEQRAANDLKVSQLRQKAVDLEGAAKKKVIEQAIALEEQLSKREVELARTRLALADLTIEANGDDIDALNDQATARANLSAAEKSAFDNTLKFRKELKGLEKDINDALKEQIALNDANRRASNQVADSGEDPLIDAFETRANVITDIDDRLQKDLVKRNKDTQDEIVRDAEKATQLRIQAERQAAGDIGSILGTVGTLFEEKSVEQKFFSSAQALINTYLAATAALASGSEINPIFGIISAAAAIATGLASVAKINGVQFAEGGVVLKGRSHAQGGIPIEAEGDEIILTKGVYRNPQLRQMASNINVAGGGRSFALGGISHLDGGFVSRSISNPIDQQFFLSDIFKNMPAPVVSVKEINTVQKSVRVKQNISKR